MLLLQRPTRSPRKRKSVCRRSSANTLAELPVSERFGMKLMAKTVLFVMAVAWFSSAALAQGPARGRIEPARDEVMEMTAKHNLTVARWYLEKRKAYEGARDRLQEII